MTTELSLVSSVNVEPLKFAHGLDHEQQTKAGGLGGQKYVVSETLTTYTLHYIDYITRKARKNKVFIINPLSAKSPKSELTLEEKKLSR